MISALEKMGRNTLNLFSPTLSRIDAILDSWQQSFHIIMFYDSFQEYTGQLLETILNLGTIQKRTVPPITSGFTITTAETFL